MRSFSFLLIPAVLVSSVAAAQSPYLSSPARSSQPAYGKAFPHWYLGLNGNVSFADDIEFNGSNADTNVGTGGNIAIGYRPHSTGSFLDSTRYELSLGYYTNSVKDIAAQIDNTTLFFNTFYDFNAQGRFKPYIGAGLGATFGRFDLQERYLRGYLTDSPSIDTNGDGIPDTGDGFADNIADGDPAAGTVDSAEYLLDGAGSPIPVYATPGDDNDMSFAYQLMAGIAYEFESVQDVEFVMGYRYIDTFETMNFDHSAASSNITTPNGIVNVGSFAGSSASNDYQAHNVDIGFRFRF